MTACSTKASRELWITLWVQVACRTWGMPVARAVALSIPRQNQENGIRLVQRKHAVVLLGG